MGGLRAAVRRQLFLGVTVVSCHEADATELGDSVDDAPQFEVLDAPVERVEAIDALWRAVNHLNVDLKMALLLRDVVGLSYNEIADSLEITLATVKWRIFKAREEVQLALGREGITFGSDATRADAVVEAVSI